MAHNHFSWEIDIRRLQNLMNTSNNDAERLTIQNLLTKEATKVSSQEPDGDLGDGFDHSSEQRPDAKPDKPAQREP